jgi:hypothetical protein
MKHLKQYSEFCLLLESEVITKDNNKELDILRNKLQSVGKDLDDDDFQYVLVDELLDVDLDVDKLDVKKFKNVQYASTLQSGGEGGGFTLIGGLIETLESFEVAQVISDIMGIDINKIKNALYTIKKIANWPFDLIKKFFFKVARFCGLNLETSKIVGISGLALVVLICFVIGLTHFPSIISAFTLTFTAAAFLKFFWALVKFSASIKSIFIKVMKIQEEGLNKKLSAMDFLDLIEKSYLGGNKIDSGFAIKFDKWFEKIDKQKRIGMSQRFTHLIQVMQKLDPRTKSKKYKTEEGGKQSKNWNEKRFEKIIKKITDKIDEDIKKTSGVKSWFGGSESEDLIKMKEVFIDLMNKISSKYNFNVRFNI